MRKYPDVLEKERMMISISDLKEFTENQELIETYADSVLALDTVENEIAQISQISIVLHTDESSQEKSSGAFRGNRRVRTLRCLCEQP